MLKSTNGLRKKALKKFLSYLFSAICVSAFVICQSCSSSRPQRVAKNVDSILKGPQFGHHHYGILVIDPTTGDTIIDRSSNRYFVPASNVKIATLYASLKNIPQQIPTIRYAISGDTIFINGLGNPATLHPKFNDSTLIQFLHQFPFVVYSENNFVEDNWAPGWAWEDFDQDYSVERSSLPLYGNVLSIVPGREPLVAPLYFRDSISSDSSSFSRAPDKNLFYSNLDERDTVYIPIKMHRGLTADLLGTLLDRKVIYNIAKPMQSENQVLYAFPRDTVLKEMMVESDNFLAEQMLLTASAAISDSLNTRKLIQDIKNDLFSDGHMAPRWVDGSGLSRYNIFTPGSIVLILKKLHTDYEWDYLKEFFPVGGQTGTLKDHFNAGPEPYITAKSGSMGNIYCLSGYLRTKSGKLLIFSFMNNSFSASQGVEIRKEMDRILRIMRDIR